MRRPAATILRGDVLARLAELPDESVHCIVTSPPYWSLRDYRLPASVWEAAADRETERRRDVETECEHEFTTQRVLSESNRAGNWTQAHNGRELSSGALGNHKHAGDVVAARKTDLRTIETGTCVKCGAWRGCLGLEPTPELYVRHMVLVFRELKRVLRGDGTCWLNLGDSYNAYNGNRGRATGENKSHHEIMPALPSGNGLSDKGLKPKDLVGIPWRVAFALQADGWYLRQDIIWHKPAPMPESVTNRCTKAHEYLFLLAKRERYYFDALAIAEPSARTGGGACFGKQDRDVAGTLAQSRTYERPEYATRNKRSVWTIASAPYAEAHFATFPPELVRPCIRAGTSAHGCCAKCGAGWVRETSSEMSFESGSGKAGNDPVGKNGAALQGGGETGDVPKGPSRATTTLGWKPGCACQMNGPEARTTQPECVPAVVLDPFAGSGTTLAVALEEGRDGLGIELNEEYVKLADKRIAGSVAKAPLFLNAD